MKRAITMACCLAIVAAPMTPAMAQSAFSKALKKKYNLRSASCYTCHMRSSEVPEGEKEKFEENKKAFRNAFGKAFDTHFAGKNITKRLADVKELESDDPKKVKVTEEVTAEFLEALTKVEKEKSADGKTYGELLKTATLKGVKPAAE
ncbi:MAG: hypothetical protein MI757_17755 [Pirellulales bacterium]|nr:hypothetical protein [Pirellulales bacterium]